MARRQHCALPGGGALPSASHLLTGFGKKEVCKDTAFLRHQQMLIPEPLNMSSPAARQLSTHLGLV
uniref:Uncharacterized protein n=1 Tax=Oryza barthii TaxID=65489 RepID=A0A0D3F0M3_9ORYZ